MEPTQTRRNVLTPVHAPANMDDMTKRWMTVEWPVALERKHTSQAAAYRHVTKVGEDFHAGRSRITEIVVKVSEDKGPWQTYERLHCRDLPEHTQKGQP